ncbi:MAG: hypothetical protein WCQ53_06740 [bacterium]
MKYYVYTAAILTLLCASCEFKKEDTKRGSHPEEYKGVRSIYVSNNNVGKSYGLYKSDDHTMPVWCSVRDVYEDNLKSFNSAFVQEAPEVVPTFFVCYSGEKPVISTKEMEASNGVAYQKNPQKTPFLQEEFTPYSRSYVIGIVLAGRGRDILPEYFSLYREFCTDEKIGCCMVNNGSDIVFNMIIEEPEDLSNIEKAITDVKTFLYNRKVSEQDVRAMFNIFKSTITDQCAFQRWYNNSLYMGVIRPEDFLEYDNWLSYFKNVNDQKIKGVGVRILDSKRLASQDYGLLKDSLNRLTNEF